MPDKPKLSHRVGIALNLRDPPHIPAYGWSYFDHMVAVYVTLNVNDPRASAVIEKSRTRPYGLTWGDIFLLENVILSLQPVDILCRNSWIIRERFREIAGPAMYDRYVESGIPRETNTPEKVDLLRADLSRILDFLHWYYALVPIRERRRKSLTINCIIMVLFEAVLLVAVLLLFRAHPHQDFLAMTSCVLFWGTLGGFVSSQRRMQSIPTDGDPLISVFGLDNAGYYLWLSPLLGSIFAMILTLLFIAHILQGTVFPDFTTVDPNVVANTFFGRVPALPADAVSYAKLFTWCFLAGFAERLVPDSLDRLASKLEPGKPAASPPLFGQGGLLPDGHDLPKQQPITAETIKSAMRTGGTDTDKTPPVPEVVEDKQPPAPPVPEVMEDKQP